MPKRSLPGVIAGERYSRQIVSRGIGGTGVGTAGATSISVPWPTTAGSVAGNVLTFLAVSLKPGAANLGAVTTPSGWTLLDSHIGGGYGTTLAADTGNTRTYLYVKQDNTNSGNLTVTITPDGANGVACGQMNRIEKTSGAWQAYVTAKAEATVDAQVGSFPVSMLVSPGDFLLYSFGLADFISGSVLLNAGADMAGLSPSLARSSAANVGFHVTSVITGRRAQRGLATIDTQQLDAGTGNICRGPMVVARVRVR